MTSPIATLVDALANTSLLDPAQQEELNTSLRGRCRDAESLALELVRRQWLTPFQAEQLLKGKGDHLVLGPYVLLELLGAGAMGEVFKARHQLMNRIVALKVIRREWLTQPQAVQRFRREIQAVAQVTHPNIVLAHDAAQVGDNWILAMEYVDGTDLATYVKESGPVSTVQACDYIRQAALGLQHAHEKGLVHRDIKPANLLLTADGKTVKILDLGLALVQSTQEVNRLATLTQEGAVMGTPAYISPEQSLDAHKADIRSDIYSLGCTLFYLLSGHAPFQGKSLTEILLKHQVEEMPGIETVRADVSPAVRVVLRRMTAKKPEDRFQTPAEVVAALAALTRVGARAPAAAALAPIPTVPERTHSQIPMPSRPAVSPHATLVEMPTGQATVPGARRPEPPPPRRWLAGVLVLMVLLAVGGFLAAPFLLRLAQQSGFGAATTPASKPAGFDSFAAVKVPSELRWDGQPKELVGVLGERDHTAINAVAISPNGRLLAVPGRDNVVVVWDLTGPSKRAIFQGHRDTVKALAFSPDGKRLASASDDQTIRFWDVDTFNLQALDSLSAHAGWVNALAFSPDGKLLASGSSDQTVRLWDVSGPKGKPFGQALREHTSPVYSVAFSPDGNLLASGSSDMSVRLWDVATGRRVDMNTDHFSSINALAFSPDGKMLASGSSDQTIILWKRDGNRLIKSATLRGHSKHVFALAFSPDGKTLTSADPGGGVIVWEYPSAEKRFNWKLPSAIYSVAYSPDSRYIVAGSGDGLVYILRTELAR